MLFQPAGDGTHEVLAAGYLAFPVVGFAAVRGVVGVDGVGGVLEDDFGHGGVGEVDGGSCGLWVMVVWWKGRKKGI